MSSHISQGTIQDGLLGCSHRAKSLEADYAALLDGSEGEDRAPSQPEDGALLNAVTPCWQSLSFALIRARCGVFLLMTSRERVAIEFGEGLLHYNLNHSALTFELAKHQRLSRSTARRMEAH